MKALIVEDDPNNVQLLCTRLKHLECQTFVAPDQDSALALAVEGEPDFILLDIKLGNEMLGGIDLMGRLKALPGVSRVPIVLHSVFVNMASDIPASLAEADYLLPKPFKFDELKAIVGKIRLALSPEGT